MTNPVVVGVDASESSGHALEWAADEAWLRHRPLHLLHAWAGEQDEAPGAGPPDGSDGERLLATASEQALLRHPGLSVTTELADRPAREALADAADRAELLALGARGSGGFSRLLLGSTSLHAAASARCPVVVVRPVPAGPLQGGVLVGLQGDGRDDRPLAFAFEAAQRRNLPLTAVHAWSYPLVSGPNHALPPVYEEGHIVDQQERLLAELTAQWRQQYPDTVVTTSAVRGGAAKELVTSSRSQQLLVVGRSREPHGPLGRLGSTSQAVVQHAQCPVAVVPDA
ncbi:universal stress protein [Kitasatospora sp. NPDC057015]|uniref:universal stress protein n=1 Tax=Kitasatospora sp. NPDC057015 TaxID=3346001 RepID=UPI00363F03DC